jgi:hypothetical protein
MRSNKLKSPFRTDPKNPKPGETYYRSRYFGQYPELVTHPVKWGVYAYDPTGQAYEPANAIKIYNSQKLADKFVDRPENAGKNWVVCGIYGIQLGG